MPSKEKGCCLYFWRQLDEVEQVDGGDLQVDGLQAGQLVQRPQSRVYGGGVTHLHTAGYCWTSG